jgi:hypothetical protein
MRVAVSREENRLEEQDRRGPDGGRAPEPRQEDPGDEGLGDEQKTGTDERGDDPEHEKG